MKYVAAAINTGTTNSPRDSIGTDVWLPESAQIPQCGLCGTQMQLFLQLDVEEKFDLPFTPGSHLVVFMCSCCNEIPSFSLPADDELPKDFWNLYEPHFFVALYKAATDRKKLDSLLRPQVLQYTPSETLRENIRIGGQPIWLQQSEERICSCGAHMHLICQIPENYRFPKIPSAPEQPDSFSENDYCLFLGNEVYIFGCSKQCHERAIWVTVQN